MSFYQLRRYEGPFRSGPFEGTKVPISRRRHVHLQTRGISSKPKKAFFSKLGHFLMDCPAESCLNILRARARLCILLLDLPSNPGWLPQRIVVEGLAESDLRLLLMLTQDAFL